MKLSLLTLLLIATTTYAQESRPRYIKVDKSTKVVKTTVSSKMVGARTFRASAYALRGRTASGKYVKYGIIAADPKTLPLGTKVRIEGMGTFIVEDTGSAIKGDRIDIWMPSNSQALRFGRRPVQLTVIE